MDKPFTAAVARTDLRPVKGRAPPDRTIVGPEGPLEMVGPEHALAGDVTLCGLPRDDVLVMGHTWRSQHKYACAACAAAMI